MIKEKIEKQTDGPQEAEAAQKEGASADLKAQQTDDPEAYLRTALLAGEIALGNGAETARADEIMKYILSASGKKSYATSVISTTLFARIGQTSGLGNIKKWDTNLNRVCMVNEVSRNLCAGKLTVYEANTQLHEIRQKTVYRFLARLIAYVVTTGVLPLFLSGNLYDCFAGAICGVVMAYANAFFRRVRVRYFVILFLQSFIMVMCTYAAALISGGLINTNIVIAASIAPMLPGLALTNAVRDTLQGDYVSGAGRLMEAVVKSLAIVLGVATGLIAGTMIPVQNMAAETQTLRFPVMILLYVIASLLTAAGYCVTMEVPLRYTVLATVVGCLGRLIDMALVYQGISDTISTLLAAAVITILAQFCAKFAKAPTILFLITGIMALVPGSHLYNSVLQFVTGNYSAGSQALIQTLFIAGAIALAIFLVDAVFNAVTQARKGTLIEK